MAPRKPVSNPPPAPSSSSEEESETEDDQELQQTQAQQNGKPKGKNEKSDTEEEDEEDDEDEEEEEEEDDEDEKQKPAAAAKVLTSKVNHPESDESESESETDSGGSQPSPTASDFAIAPITSKPMDDSAKPKKDSAKRNQNTTPTATPVKSVGSKRASESDAEKKDAKKKKKVSDGGADEDVKKVSGIHRLWSEEDEIEVLKGMIDYRTKKGSDPYADMGAFYEFIRKRVHANVSKNQVIDKLRRLKKKYQTYAEKSVDGKDPVLSKPHENQAYDLSKRIWGPDSVENVDKNKKKSGQSGKAKSHNATPVKKKDVDADGVANGEASAVGKESFSQDSALLSVFTAENITSDPEATLNLVKAALPSIDSAKAKEFDQKWKELQREQFQMFMKRTGLLLEGAKLVLEAMKSDKA